MREREQACKRQQQQQQKSHNSRRDDYAQAQAHTQTHPLLSFAPIFSLSLYLSLALSHNILAQHRTYHHYMSNPRIPFLQMPQSPKRKHIRTLCVCVYVS